MYSLLSLLYPKIRHQSPTHSLLPYRQRRLNRFRQTILLKVQNLIKDLLRMMPPGKS